MSTQAHTPGPWALGFDSLRGGTYWCVSRGDDLQDIDIHEDENGEADARLIAAAPDMLAALKEVVSVSKSGAQTIEFLVQLRQLAERCATAVAKAEGRS